MSSVPPLRDDDVALVAAWPARPDTPARIAEQLSVLIGAVSKLEPAISGWKRPRAKSVAAIGDVDALADLIERGAVTDSQRPPQHIRAAGYLQWLEPVGVRGAELLISAGQVSPTAISSCALRIRPQLPGLRTAEAAQALIRAAVDAFEPGWATWTVAPFGEADQLTDDGRALGYLNYGAVDLMHALDPNAAPYGSGAIAALGDDPQIGDPQVVRRHLRARSAAARSIAARSTAATSTAPTTAATSTAPTSPDSTGASS